MVSCGTKDMHLIKLQHKFYSIRCDCGAVNQVETKDEVSGEVLKKYHIIGPSLGAMVLYDYFSNHLSISKIQNSYFEKYGVIFSIGAILEGIHSNGLRLEAESNKIKDRVLESKILHADETSYKLKFKNQWVWVFTNGFETFYTLGGRTKNVADSILSEYKGMLCSDGYKAYRDYPDRIRCLAHIRRKIERLIDSVDKNANLFGNYLAEFFNELFELVYANRESNVELFKEDRIILSKIDYADELFQLKTVCELYKKEVDTKSRALAIELLKDWECFFKILDNTDLPLTNNVAERALRTLVIKRKISLSTQSLVGSKVLGISYSVITTLKNKKESIINGLINILSPPNILNTLYKQDDVVTIEFTQNYSKQVKMIKSNQHYAEAC